MHIKNSLVKGYKTDFAGFELDASKIELHSTHKWEIRLPYSGSLPDALQDNDGAVISIGISVHLTVGISLIVTKGKDKIRCLIAATPQEVNDILFRFSFRRRVMALIIRIGIAASATTGLVTTKAAIPIGHGSSLRVTASITWLTNSLQRLWIFWRNTSHTKNCIGRYQGGGVCSRSFFVKIFLRRH